MSTPTDRPLIHGVIPPLVTPLAETDELDPAALERLVEHVVGGGVQALFILGSTGEGPSLSQRLKREVVTAMCRAVNSRVPVLVGISDTSWAESVALARYAAEAGAAAVVATTPYYFKPAQPEIVAYFSALAAAVPLPLFLYNMPGLAGAVIEPASVRQLMEVPGIIGLKDSSGDWDYFSAMLELARERPEWALFMGREELGVRAMSLGAHGVVPGGANLVPRLHADAYDAVRTGDRDRAQTLDRRIAQVAEAIFTLGCPGAGFIQSLKAALAFAGLTTDRLAPPFPPLSSTEKSLLHSRLIALNLLPNP